MSKSPTTSPPTGTPPTTRAAGMSEAERAAGLREERLTKALRANLRRRKAPRGTAETIEVENGSSDDSAGKPRAAGAASSASEKSQDPS